MIKKLAVITALALAAFSAFAEKKEYFRTTKHGDDYAFVETYDDDVDAFAVIGEAMAKLKEEGYAVEYSTEEMGKRLALKLKLEQQHVYSCTHKKGGKVVESHVYTLLSEANERKAMRHIILARKATEEER